MKTSYTAHIQGEMESAKQRVIKILHWTELEYAEFQMKMGKQYLQSYISTDPCGIDMLIDSRIFWNWWKNQWLIRDTSFIASNIGKVNRSTAVAVYQCLHNADVLIQSIYPSRAVLDNSYAQMIDNVIKSEL